METTIYIDGYAVQAQFSECTLHTSGEFGGNLDFAVKFNKPVSTSKVLQNLRVKLPDHEKLIDVAGYGEFENGLNITMYSDLASTGDDIDPDTIPSNVDVFWLENDDDLPVGKLQVNAQGDADGERQQGSYREDSTPEAGGGCGATIFVVLVVLLASVLATSIS